MKKFSHKIVAILLLGFALPHFSACTMCKARKNSATSLQHVVIVWLKEPGNTQHINQLIAQADEFRKIDGVLSVQAGTSLKSERPMVEKTYDLGLVMTFRDEAAMDAYLRHPVHEKAVREVLTPLAAKAIAYDFR